MASVDDDLADDLQDSLARLPETGAQASSESLQPGGTAVKLLSIEVRRQQDDESQLQPLSPTTSYRHDL